MGISKISYHIQINVKMQNSSQEPPASFKAPNEDLKDMDVLCTFKMKIESKNLDHGYIKDQWPYPNKIKMPNPTQESPASSKAPNEDFMDMDVLCTFKIKKESQNSDYGYIKDQWPYPNQDQDATSQSGTSSILQSPKWGLKEHGYSWHLGNQEREPKFGSWVYQRPLTISKLRWRCQTPVRNL